MQPFLVTLGKGLKGPARMNGALFLGDKGLYFLCTSVGRTGSNDFSPFGPIGTAIEAYKKSGNVPTIDEAALSTLVGGTQNSFHVAPDQIETFSRSMWTGSKIVLKDGEKLVVWAPGFAGQFRDQTRSWAQAKNVKAKGL